MNIDYKNKYLKYKQKYFNLKKQLGGNFISSGASGCVYSPPLKCEENNCVGEKCTTGISKVMNGISADQEGSIYQILQLDRIDQESRYTIGSPHICKPEITEDLLEPCRATNVNITNPKQIIFENGGIDLFMLIQYINSLDDKQRHVDYVLRNLLNIANGIALLNQNNICHNDVKIENIVTGLNRSFNIDAINGRFRLIDFGLSVNYSSEYIETRNIFNNENGKDRPLQNIGTASCLDKELMFYLLSYEEKRKQSSPNSLKNLLLLKLTAIYGKYSQSEEQKKFYDLMEYNIKSITGAFNKLMETHLDQTNIKQSIDDLLKFLISKEDIYAFGYILYMLCYYQSVSIEQEDIIIAYLRETNMVHYDPEMRPPSSELGRLYRELLRRLEL